MTERIAPTEGWRMEPAAHAESVPEDVYGSWSASPAPGGDRVAFVSDRGGRPQVWVREPDGLLRLPVATKPALSVSWSPAGAWLVLVTTTAGSSRNELWAVRPDGSDLHLAAGSAAATAFLGGGPWHGWSSDGRLLVTESADLMARTMLVDPATGARQPIHAGEQVLLQDVSLRRDGTGTALIRVGPRGARHLIVVDFGFEDDESLGLGVDVASRGPAPRRLVTGLGSDWDGTRGSESDGSVERAALAADGCTVYARTDVGRDRAALVAVDLTDPAARPVVVAERVDAEIQDAVLSGDGASAVLLWNVHGGLSALGLLDLATGRQEPIPVLPRDVVDECRLLPDGKGLLLTAESWSDPRGVWTIDLVTGEQRPLSSRGGHELLASRGATPSTVDIVDLTRPELRRFRARDGLELTGWLYRPDAPGPWPTMIHLHGGPEAQERPVYNSLFQSLVAAGVAVFAPNVRGSSGLGREFLRADDREKRYGAITDVADCVAHLTGAGIADPARVGVMGRSYGGYLTLAALVRHPELFAVGIDVCGMADFLTFYEHTEPWIAAAAMAKYGDPVADAELLTDLSPIHRIDRLRAPLLVVHGAEDTNVPVEEAEQVVAALARRGVPHRYLLFPGEGHDLLSTPNRVAFVQAAVAWVVEHLSVPAIPA